MNLLSNALGTNINNKPIIQASSSYSLHKAAAPKQNTSIWLLDCDYDDQQQQVTVSNDVNMKFTHIVQLVIQKKFHNDKFHDQNENIHSQIINELSSHLIDLPTQLAKLTRIESAIVLILDSYQGEMKSNLISLYSSIDHLKNFQSLLDIRIRKLKRKQKKTELTEYEKIVHHQQLQLVKNSNNTKKKQNEVIYIDQDRDEKKHIHRKQNRIKNTKNCLLQSKKSYGTMNSKSNNNESGSCGQGSAGSESRSSEGNALTVLLSNRGNNNKNNNKNINNNDQNIDNKIQSSTNTNTLINNESYNFSAMISNSVAVRQRVVDRKTINKQGTFYNQTIKSTKMQIKKKDSNTDQKNQAFIFYRPMKDKKHL